MSGTFPGNLSSDYFGRKVLGYAWTPSAIAAVIGPPVGAALVGKDYIW